MSEYRLRIKHDELELEYVDEYCWFIELQAEQIFKVLFSLPVPHALECLPSSHNAFSTPNSNAYKLVLRRGHVVIELSADEDVDFMQRQMHLWFKSLVNKAPFNLLENGINKTSDKTIEPYRPSDLHEDELSNGRPQNGNHNISSEELSMAFQ